VKHGINFSWDENEVRHIMLDEQEIIPPGQMRDILQASGFYII
jgi:hypothetical protein